MKPSIFSPLRRNARSVLAFACVTPRCRLYSTTTAPPLRILFCGADKFSIHALTAVHNEARKNPRNIASIDVVCRPPKRVGAGLKRIREVPIKQVAKDLSLPIHEIDTFTGWELPSSPQGHAINLIIAVSFGLFIPPRILKAAAYGGINLHPSLLPDFRGPAPLHHILLCGERRAGITLQTLHPEKFDHGLILGQDAFDIPDPDSCNVDGLLDLVCVRGAEMLAAAVRQRTFESSFAEEEGEKACRSSYSSSSTTTTSPIQPRHAPKITKEDSHLDWDNWTAEAIARRQRLLGPLWNFASIPSHPHTVTTPPNEQSRKRIIFENLEPLSSDTAAREAIIKRATTVGIGAGVPFAVLPPDDTLPDLQQTPRPPSPSPLYVLSPDKELFGVDRIKIEGRNFAPACSAAMQAKMMPNDFKFPDGPDEVKIGLASFFERLG